MRVFVVVPAFNEGRVIRGVLERVSALGHSVVVVDDASDDNTAEEAERAGVTVLRHIINRGQGAALRTGIVYALRQCADAIVTFDSDGQHDVADVDRLLEPVRSGQFDVVLGSRFLGDGARDVPPLRRTVLRLGVLFTRAISNINVTDTHNGLRAMTRSAADRIRIHQDRMAHASEILDEIARLKLRYTEVPVTITYSYYSRGKGQSSFALFKIAVRFLLAKIRQ